MNSADKPVARDLENPDPQELHKPIPKKIVFLALVLVTWAVCYIAQQSPGLSSSSSAASHSVSAPRAG